MMRDIRQTTGLLFLFATALLITNPAAAVPIKNNEKCQGPVTFPVSKCADTPNHWVECNNSGDYMCCKPNDQGGKDCEQIEAKTLNPKAGINRLPGGVLQNAPATTMPKQPRVPRAGMNAPIMRRGIEGEEPSPESTTPAEPTHGDK